jgi:catechol 2,3-dioxygenase-like lactoylglutathione lyase family enzyme
MRRQLFLALALVAATLFVFGHSRAAGKSPRPKILGIQSVQILSSDVAGAEASFYSRVLTLGQPCDWCEKNTNNSTFLPSGQVVTLAAIPAKPPAGLIASITFAVDDLNAMKRYLQGAHVAFQEVRGPFTSWGQSLTFLTTLDPEGHRLYFVAPQSKGKPSSAGPSLIHSGFVVRDRTTMDKFYKDVLGFHVYWSGGMKDGETDWVDMQVPDGTDWIEYMLNIPENANKRLLGIMNHIALGVPDIHVAANQLEKAGLKLTEEPKIGRDGKWQLNLYDPDQTRVELMEFKPVQKPCCSDFTGPNPGQ